MRRRKSRGTWLPVFGNLAGAEGFTNTVEGVDGQITVDLNAGITTNIHVLTLDSPNEGESDERTLADVLGSEYLLRRIVGKFHALSFADPTAPVYALVSAGFCVARAQPGAQSFYPLGADGNVVTSNFTAAQQSFSPLEQETQREPWIWRRSWILSNAEAPVATGTSRGFPSSTAEYGSVADGPHLDAKTMRRVGADDRLYFIVSTVTWPISQTAAGGGEEGLILYHLDYRLFGSLRKARQTGSF